MSYTLFQDWVKSPRYAEGSLSKASRISLLPQLRLQGYEQTCHTIQASTDKQRMVDLNANTSSLWAFGYVCRCNEKVHACWCLTWLVAHVVYRLRAVSPLPWAFVSSCSAHSTERSISRLQPYQEFFTRLQMHSHEYPHKKLVLDRVLKRWYLWSTGGGWCFNINNGFLRYVAEQRREVDVSNGTERIDILQQGRCLLCLAIALAFRLVKKVTA